MDAQQRTKAMLFTANPEAILLVGVEGEFISFGKRQQIATYVRQDRKLSPSPRPDYPYFIHQ
jgi:hypothetical protein